VQESLHRPYEPNASHQAARADHVTTQIFDRGVGRMRKLDAVEATIMASVPAQGHNDNPVGVEGIS
jgi:hypothetical protein